MADKNLENEAVKAAEEAARLAAEAAEAKAEAARMAADAAREKAKAAADAAKEAAFETENPRMAEAPTVDEVFDEFRKVGSQIMDAVGAAWDSDERRKFQEDLKAGFSSIASNVEVKVDSLRSDPEMQDRVEQAKSKARDVADNVSEKMRDNETAQEVASSVVTGLRFLSKQLDNLATELQNSGGDSDAAKSETQNISINVKKKAKKVEE